MKKPVVVHFLRHPIPGYYSIERIFDEVRRHLPEPFPVRVCVARFHRGVLRRIYNGLEARARQADINHVTGDVHYLVLFLKAERTVLTIHDCGILAARSGWRRVILRFFWYQWPVRRAAAVTVISEFTRQELLSHVSCDPAKVHVIPNPVSDAFVFSPKPFPEEDPLFLFIGSTPNKNLTRVAEALAGLTCRLRVVGSIAESDRSKMDLLGVRYTQVQGLDDDQLLDEYRNADALLFPSTYEGFGMPIVEAQAVGRPVITSNVGPMPDVAGGAACLVDPFSVASIREGVARVCRDPAYRGRMVSGGVSNSRRFAAKAIAEMYCDLYQQILIGSLRDRIVEKS